VEYPNEPTSNDTDQKICTLVYSECGGRGASSGSSPVILIAVWDQNNRLSLYVNSEWREFVSRDLEGYFASLLEDFRQRKESDPEGLFRHLSALNVGPMAALEVTTADSGEPFKGVPSGFTELT